MKATEPGFRAVQIRPDLSGLEWVRGAVPTPRGAIRVDARQDRIAVTIPVATEAAILLPSGEWKLNGAAVRTQSVENGARVKSILHHAGRFEFVRQ